MNIGTTQCNVDCNNASSGCYFECCRVLEQIKKQTMSRHESKVVSQYPAMVRHGPTWSDYGPTMVRQECQSCSFVFRFQFVALVVFYYLQNKKNKKRNLQTIVGP